VVLTLQNYQENIAESHGLAMLAFTAKWCSSCKAMYPIMERADWLRIYLVDAEEEEKLVQQFGVQSLPTFILFRDGCIISELRGKVKSELFLAWARGDNP
jgi:thioredoxin 1